MNTKEAMKEAMARLEAGIVEVLQSGRWKEYLAVQARFHNYSPGNALLILIQRPDATLVAGYRTWQSIGRYVRKGEKAIRILAPIIARGQGDEDVVEVEKETGKKPGTGIVVGFRTVCVFDISQTEGKALPEIAPRLTGSSAEAEALVADLMAVAEARGIRVQDVPEADLPGEALGGWCPGTRTISLLEGIAMDQRAKTLAHEMAHALLHGSDAVNGLVPREQAEVEAESVAFVLCYRYGLDTSVYSFDYVAAWSDDPKAVRKVAERVQKTVAAIIKETGKEEAAGGDESSVAC